MVLASAGGTLTLVELATSADKVMEISISTLSHVTSHNNQEIEQLQSEIADLKSL